MTDEMPSTNPNIMMTARLLLMPVFKSVELNVVLWAKAETVLSANRAATVRSGRNRAKIFGASNFFMALFFCCRLSSAALPLIYATTISNNVWSEGANFAQNATKAVLEKRDGHKQADQTPRTGLVAAAR